MSWARPGYLAPEQIDGRARRRRAIGSPSEWSRTSSSWAGCPRPRTARLAAPVEVIFDRALADRPSRRYPTATAFVDALRTAPAADPARTGGHAHPQKTAPSARRLRVSSHSAGSPAAPARHRQRTRLWRARSAFFIAALAVAAPATAGGVVLGRKLARDAGGATTAGRYPVRGLAVRPRRERGRLRHRRHLFLPLAGRDALGARKRLGVSSRHAPARPGQRPPERSQPRLRARPGRLVAAVYDDFGRQIGTDLCHAYAAAGWALRS